METKHGPVLSIPEGQVWGPGKAGLWEQRGHLLGTPTLLLFLRGGEGRGGEGEAPARLPWLSSRRPGELACGVQALGCVCRTPQPPGWEESLLAGGQCLHSP